MLSVRGCCFNFLCQTISNCSCNLFLVIEPTGRISLASFSDLQCYTRDQLWDCFHNIPDITALHNCTVFAQLGT